MQNNIIIRKARLIDIDILCDLLSGLFAVETDFNAGYRKQDRALYLLINDDNKDVFVAADGAVIAGMITGQTVVSTAAGGLSVLLEDLFVVPGYRGKGIATMLMRHLLLWGKAKGAVRVQLVADERNPAALDLYKKAGFALSNMRGLYKFI
ncbi:MAG: GNAT family N-acetyltransferase [Spirochaetota bacterium]